MDALHPSFDFQRGHARFNQVRKGFDHAKVSWTENICSPVILRNRHILSGARFLDNGISPSAGVGAHAPVAASPGHEAAQQAPPGNSHAHGAVNKGFDFHVRRGNDFPYFGEGQLPGDIDSLHPGILPEQRALDVGGVGLGAEVDGDVRNYTAGQSDDAGICDNNGIWIETA